MWCDVIGVWMDEGWGDGEGGDDGGWWWVDVVVYECGVGGVGDVWDVVCARGGLWGADVGGVDVGVLRGE